VHIKYLDDAGNELINNMHSTVAVLTM